MIRVLFVVLIGVLFFGCSKIADEFVRNNSVFVEKVIKKSEKNIGIYIEKVSFSSDGRYLYLEENDNRIKIFDMINLTLREKIIISKEKEKGNPLLPFGSFTIFSASPDYGDKISSRKLRFVFDDELEEELPSVLSPNKQIKASITSDGSVSLYDTITNKKFITIKIFGNKNRGKKVVVLGKVYENTNADSWFAITPEGYYAGSPDAYKYFDVERSYEKFYRPDIVKLALEGKSVPNLPKISDVKPAPIVRIVNTRKEDNKLKFTLEVSPRSGGVGDIRLYHNGTAVVETKAVSTGKKIKKPYSITLVEGDNTINAIAFERTNSKHSKEAVYTVKSTKKRVVKPNIHALVIGVEEFEDSRLNLEHPYEDTQLVEKILNAQEQGLFNKVFVKRLATKSETSKENILKELAKFQNIDKDDTFILYISSHGAVEDGEYYLISSNVGSSSEDPLKEEALSGGAIKKLISNIPALKKLMVFDTCYSGALGKVLEQSTHGSSEGVINVLNHATGSAILSASTASEEAIANGYRGYSIFTRILVDGLEGFADRAPKNSEVDTLELAGYLHEKLPLISEEKFKYKQVPMNSNRQIFSVSQVEK